jgi:hypothetical protein
VKKFYRKLPLVRELLEIRNSLGFLTSQALVHSAILREQFFRELLSTPRYADPRKLNRYEHQVFSQNGEDGIIAEIFKRIGAKNRSFVELGVGDGLENNTAFLVMQGWKGGWVESSADCVTAIQREFRQPLEARQLKLLHSFITAENVTSLVERLELPELDFLSIDIDRNTSHVWRTLGKLRPRVVAIEYNATFPSDVAWEIPYDSQRTWNRTACFGASLKTLESIGKERGYALVGCDFSGTNAFFVREDESLSKFAEPFTAENHYEPPRYWTVRGAHPRGFSDT